MCVRIANRNTNNNDRNCFFSQMYNCTIGWTSTANCILNRDAKLFCQIKRISLVTWIGNHAWINVTKHRATLNSSLNHILLNARIICRAAFKNNCDIRLNYLCCHSGTTYTNFFLCCTSANNIHIQILTSQSMHGLKNCRTSQTTVKALAHHQICGFWICKCHIRHYGFTDTNAELFNRLFFRNSANIYRDIFHIQRCFTLLLCHEMRRLTGSNTWNIFSESVANQDFMSGNIVVHPTSDLNDAESSVRADSLHHKTNLITMCVKLNNRTFAVIFFTADIQVAHAIFCNFSESFCVRTNRCNHFIFETGCTVCIWNCCNHFQRCFFIHSDTSLWKF